MSSLHLATKTEQAIKKIYKGSYHNMSRFDKRLLIKDVCKNVGVDPSWVKRVMGYSEFNDDNSNKHSYTIEN
jgi:hypothetical protein